jgi:hypothetical protein
MFTSLWLQLQHVITINLKAYLKLDIPRGVQYPPASAICNYPLFAHVDVVSKNHYLHVRMQITRLIASACSDKRCGCGY